VSKACSRRELTARVKSVMRRAAGPVPARTGTLEAGRLAVDLDSHEVRLAGRPISLTSLEFDLLSFLMLHPNRVFRREQLLAQVWGYTFGDTSTVTVHVRRLREKIEAEPSRPVHIKTVWGVGYLFEG